MMVASVVVANSLEAVLSASMSARVSRVVADLERGDVRGDGTGLEVAEVL